MKRFLSVVTLVAYGALQAHAQTAVVTGQVRERDGQPAVQTRVALAAMNEKGHITPDVLVGLTTTDGTGRYRIEDVEPGRYGLIAGTVVSPTYYPGTAEAFEAKVLSIASGTTLTGLDFTLAAPLTVSRVRGVGHYDTAADILSNATNFPTDLPDDEVELLAYLTLSASRHSATQAPPSTFAFALTGVQGRTVSFVGIKGGTFRSACIDCSFLVGEAGIGDPSSASVAGVVFKLSASGESLAATCRAAECLIVSPGGNPISRLPNSQTNANDSTLPVLREISVVETVYFRVTK
jgi:hypothetical protein